MTTWICKSGAFALALSFLTACEGGQTTGLFNGLGNNSARLDAKVLTQTPMAFGAMTLVAPSGYCVDTKSLKPRFALLARCDVLVKGGDSGGAPLGVIAVSLTASDEDAALPMPSEMAKAFKLSALSDPVANDSNVVFRARGVALSKGMSADHWRGSTLIKGQMISLALYGPPDGAAVSSEGRAILTDLIKRTQQSNT